MSLQAAIKKRFSGFSLDVSLNTDGGVMGILGASGSGKSMTLKCIAGIETPDEGRIVLNGRVLFDSEKRINLPLLTIGDFHYYVPISSAKPKHQKMSNSLDFHKLLDESTGYLYAVLNINNMIPVPDNCLTQLKYNQVESFRSFSNEKEKTDYVYLLQKEKALIDNVQDTLQNKAMKLYQKCIAKPDSSLAARCCDFKMLEEKCSSYSDT